MHGMHDLGVVILFCTDLLINVGIESRLGLRRDQRGAHDQSKEATGLKHSKTSPGGVQFSAWIITAGASKGKQRFVSRPQRKGPVLKRMLSEFKSKKGGVRSQ
jgi:hypothetical protein